jgi:hypothetical protein
MLLIDGIGRAAVAGVLLSAAATIVTVRLPRRPASAPCTLGDSNVAAGIRALTSPHTLPLVAATIGVNVLAGLLGTTLVAWSAGVSSDGTRLFGTLTLAQGVGAAGAFVWIVRTGSGERSRTASFVTAALAVVAIGASGRPSIAIGAAVVVGGAIVAAELGATAALGRAASGRAVAAATGLLDAAMVASMLVGVVLAYASTVVLTPGGTLVVAGLLGVCCAFGRSMR